MATLHKNFQQKTAALDDNGINYTEFMAINNNRGLYWNCNGYDGAAVYLPTGECIGEWDMFLGGNPETDDEPTYIFRPATYTDPNLDGAALCTPETRHWTECLTEGGK